jgi:hypothetical protein
LSGLRADAPPVLLGTSLEAKEAVDCDHDDVAWESDSNGGDDGDNGDAVDVVCLVDSDADAKLLLDLNDGDSMSPVAVFKRSAGTTLQSDPDSVDIRVDSRSSGPAGNTDIDRVVDTASRMADWAKHAVRRAFRDHAQSTVTHTTSTASTQQAVAVIPSRDSSFRVDPKAPTGMGPPTQIRPSALGPVPTSSPPSGPTVPVLSAPKVSLLDLPVRVAASSPLVPVIQNAISSDSSLSNIQTLSGQRRPQCDPILSKTSPTLDDSQIIPKIPQDPDLAPPVSEGEGADVLDIIQSDTKFNSMEKSLSPRTNDGSISERKQLLQKALSEMTKQIKTSSADQDPQSVLHKEKSPELEGTSNEPSPGSVEARTVQILDDVEVEDSVVLDMTDRDVVDLSIATFVEDGAFAVNDMSHKGSGPEVRGDAMGDLVVNTELGGEELKQLLVEEEAEEKSAKRVRNAAARDAESMTEEMKVEVIALLKAFGLPYVIAPYEAEAQCAGESFLLLHPPSFLQSLRATSVVFVNFNMQLTHLLPPHLSAGVSRASGRHCHGRQ